MIVKHKSGVLLEVKREYSGVLSGYLLDNKRQRVITPRGKRICFSRYCIRIVAIRDCTEVQTTRQPTLFE